MRYRLLDPAGDYSFGKNQADFLVDSPATVAQLILTRLKLWTGEWFLDLTEGTAWTTQVVGYGTASVRDQMIRNRILSTDGVLARMVARVGDTVRCPAGIGTITSGAAKVLA